MGLLLRATTAHTIRCMVVLLLGRWRNVDKYKLPHVCSLKSALCKTTALEVNGMHGGQQPKKNAIEHLVSSLGMQYVLATWARTDTARHCRMPPSLWHHNVSMHTQKLCSCTPMQPDMQPI